MVGSLALIAATAASASAANAFGFHARASAAVPVDLHTRSSLSHASDGRRLFTRSHMAVPASADQAAGKAIPEHDIHPDAYGHDDHAGHASSHPYGGMDDHEVYHLTEDDLHRLFGGAGGSGLDAAKLDSLLHASTLPVSAPHAAAASHASPPSSSSSIAATRAYHGAEEDHDHPRHAAHYVRHYGGSGDFDDRHQHEDASSTYHSVRRSLDELLHVLEARDLHYGRDVGDDDGNGSGGVHEAEHEAPLRTGGGGGGTAASQFGAGFGGASAGAGAGAGATSASYSALASKMGGTSGTGPGAAAMFVPITITPDGKLSLDVAALMKASTAGGGGMMPPAATVPQQADPQQEQEQQQQQQMNKRTLPHFHSQRMPPRHQAPYDASAKGKVARSLAANSTSSSTTTPAGAEKSGAAAGVLHSGVVAAVMWATAVGLGALTLL